MVEIIKRLLYERRCPTCNSGLQIYHGDIREMKRHFSDGTTGHIEWVDCPKCRDFVILQGSRDYGYMKMTYRTKVLKV